MIKGSSAWLKFDGFIHLVLKQLIQMMRSVFRKLDYKISLRNRIVEGSSLVVSIF